jgi:hypothetical protein
MKKMYFAAAAVALAVLLAGCDAFAEPEELAKADNSEGLIISIRNSDGDGRALTTPIAAAGADYYEVIFNNHATPTPRIVRTSWGNGATGRIIPADGDYDNSLATGKGDAYIFAGRNGTLLGVGVLVDVINGTAGAAGNTVINMANATGVVFEITALNTEIGGLKNPLGTPSPGPNPANSTFKLPATGFNPTNHYGSIVLDASQSPVLSAPVFVVSVPKLTADEATFDITNTAGTSLSTGAVGTLNAKLRSAIIAVSTSDPDPDNTLNKVDCSGYLWEKGSAPFAEVKGATTGITADAVLPIPIHLDIIPGMKTGLSKMVIEIPVVLYQNIQSSNFVDPVMWYIRGGINNGTADLGAAFNDGDGSLGGAIIIGVGEYNKNSAGLIVSWKPTI